MPYPPVFPSRSASHTCAVLLAALTGLGGGCGDHGSERGAATDETSTGDAPAAQETAAEAPVDEERAMALVVEGNRMLREGDAQGALARFDESLMAAPDFGLAYLGRGEAGQHVGLDDAVIETSFELAIERLPENPRAHYLQAVYFEARGRTDEARAGYKATLLLRPDHADARARFAARVLAEGDFQEAQRQYEMALRDDPDKLSALIGLADAAEKAGDLEAAEAVLRRAVRESPTSVGNRQRLIRFYNRTGQPEKGKRATDELDRVDPTDERKLRPLRSRRAAKKARRK